MARLMSSRQCVASDISPGTRTARRPASSTQRAVSLASSCSQRYEISRSAPSRAKAIATPTDSGIGAGDQCGAPSQLATAPIRMLTVIRIGIHLGGQPRAGLLLAAERGTRSRSLRIRDHETPIYNFGRGPRSSQHPHGRNEALTNEFPDVFSHDATCRRPRCRLAPQTRVPKN
jgi:hypothetical protein